jgi:cysteine desulfurase
MMTLDSHKLYGPRGIGMLYKRRGINIKPIIHGGNQEGGLRSGTENIPGIAGFAYAMQKAFENKVRDTLHISELKQYFSNGLKNINKDIIFNVDTDKSSPHILSIIIPNIDNEMFLLRLDAKGISVSTKSACLRDENESYVLKAIGINNSKNVIRFSFGNNTKKSDLDYVLRVMSNIMKKF